MLGMPSAGPIKDEQLMILENVGIISEFGRIRNVGDYEELKTEATEFIELEGDHVGLPGFIDCHTHICYAGSRAADYARRLSGMGYQEIAAAGGGILDTVRSTRAASKERLVDLMLHRLQRLRDLGVTTCEVKSGYGLSVADEIKMLEAIDEAGQTQKVSIVATCLAAHTLPPEAESAESYLAEVVNELLPQVSARRLARRVDIFIEQGAFSPELARSYLKQAKDLGFQLTVHADQFSLGGSQIAAEMGALSADHLEVSGPEEIAALAKGNVVPVVLPGASIGLGMPFAATRQLLDAGLPVAIASDWNPGSAPMGNLLAQASFLAAAEKLTMAETLAGITVRAAMALDLEDRGRLEPGCQADIAIFPCGDYREILYHQGELRPTMTVISGRTEVAHATA